MKKQIINKIILGFPIGICISILITLAISLKIGNGEYIPVPITLANDFNTEINAFIFQLLLSGLFGSIIGGASVIWNTEWSLLKMTIVHFIIITTSSFPVAYFLRWMPRNSGSIFSFYLVFILIYLIIWVILYLNVRRQINKINKNIN